MNNLITVFVYCHSTVNSKNPKILIELFYLKFTHHCSILNASFYNDINTIEYSQQNNAFFKEYIH